MAGKGSKKGQENFEKMKREMIAKKEKAKIQQNLETLQIETEGNELIKMLSADFVAEKQDECLCVVKKDIKETNKIEIIVFKVGEEEFALRISNIKEIIRIPSMTNIPNAHHYIAGLCSLRGELMPVIDSRKLFGMPEKEFEENSRIIVADIHGKKVGLVSDKVSEVITVEEVEIKEPPASIKGIHEGMINSILILNNGERVVMLLDAEKIIMVGNIDVANKQHASVQNLKVLEMEEDQEEQLVIFNIGVGEYAFNINCVKEIIRLPDIIKVPNTPSYIEGVLAIRNQLLATVNLEKLFDIDCKEPDEYSRVVIINNGKISFGVIVNKVSHVIRVQEKLFKESSQIANGSYIKGIFNIDDGKRMIMLLEPNKLISIEEIEGISNVDHKEISNDKSSYVDKEDNSFEHIVVFKLGVEEYGIKINNVQEINIMSEITRLPRVPDFIAGMVNLRGDIITILNLKRLFTSNDSVACDSSKLLVVEFQNRRIGIMIDSASEVLKCSKSYIQEASEVFDVNDKYIDKIAKLNDGKRIILILNLKTVLNFM